MTKLNPIDILNVTVANKGVSHIFTQITGITSLCDIVNRMKVAIPGLTGLTTIDIRNTTEGWTSRRSVFLR